MAKAEEIKPEETQNDQPQDDQPKVQRSIGDVVVGTIKMWSVARNHGFLKCDDGGDDLFCHRTALQCQEGFAAVMGGTRVKGVIEKNPGAKDKDDSRFVLGQITAEDGELLPGYESKQDFVAKKVEQRKLENPNMMEVSLVVNKVGSGKIIGQGGERVRELQESHEVNISIYPPTLEISEAELGSALQMCKIKGEKDAVFAAAGSIFKLFVDLMEEKKDEIENLNTVLFGKYGKLLSKGTTVATILVALTSLEAVEGELKKTLEATGVSVTVLSKEKVGKHFCLVFTGTPEQIREAVAATVLGLPDETWYQPRPLLRKRKNSKKNTDKKQKGQTTGRQRGGPAPPPEFKFGKRRRPKEWTEPAWTGSWGGYGSGGYGGGYDASWSRAPKKQSSWQSFYDQNGEQYYRNILTGECHY